MLRYLLIMTVFVGWGLGIEIKINPDKSLSSKIEEKEIQIIEQEFLKNHIKISKKDAEKYIKDNRILANEYIKEFGISKDLYIALRLDIEKRLSNIYIKEKQKKLYKITNEVIESYYKTHIDDFVEDEKIIVDVYKFDNFDKALSFFKEKDNKSRDATIMKDVELEKSRINPVIAPAFQYAKDKIGQKLPPIYFNGKYIVFIIKQVIPARKKTLSESRKEIQDILYNKIFLRTKNDIVKKIEKENKL